MAHIPDQRKMWDRKHGANEHALFKGGANEFAKRAESMLQPKSSILELGCGVGRDASHFASNGHTVLATDLSPIVIEHNRSRTPIAGLTYQDLDLKNMQKFADDSFDMVYVHLSLHYFDNKVTLSIFREIHRILKSNGNVAFVCKTIDDKYFGLGERIDKNMFLYKGRVRHFFSRDYVYELLNKSGYEIIELKDVKSKLYNDSESSATVSCIAKKV